MFGPRYVSSLQLPRAVARSSPRVRLPSTRCRSTSSKPPNFFRLTYLWYGVVLATGASAGYAVRNFAAPPSLPTPGSREDQLALGALKKDMDKLDIVTFMRSQCAPPTSDTPLDESEEEKRAWVELDIKRNIAETEATEDNGKVTRIATEQTLAGSQGLGIQRAFWNSETRELVAVVWIGGALSGWPTLAHGGAVATIFEDAMVRMVAGPDVSPNSIPGPSSMSVIYAQPTHVLNFYILRANFTKPRIAPAAPLPDPQPTKSWLPFWKDLTKKTPYTGAQPSVEIIGTLESVKGDLCVRAKGVFPISTA
ncbi:hypothetical protein K505DRAFT_258206 [Melanomma pulvis-pyrius CBS 109.77]|uniref:Thioesterase domain-containing protein n=1 Tax=Melanomma pulvis-pyrius CBS 109.77 TaxID=1314802 RepID=A0A6A6WTH0_9PLEO|nr:hypothetical protein K505DRAFT_258206 [Melanomma pulvis-pyrius CBS 109.77]